MSKTRNKKRANRHRCNNKKKQTPKGAKPRKKEPEVSITEARILLDPEGFFAEYRVALSIADEVVEALGAEALGRCRVNKVSLYIGSAVEEEYASGIVFGVEVDQHRKGVVMINQNPVTGRYIGEFSKFDAGQAYIRHNNGQGPER